MNTEINQCETLYSFVKNIVKPFIGKKGVRENIQNALRSVGLPVSNLYTKKGSGFSGEVSDYGTHLTVQIGANEGKKHRGGSYTIVNLIEIKFTESEFISFSRNKVIDEILADLV
ncbi:MAG: hypothetical protein EOP45_07730 [Sphingobacteriaceae bacterium]|nr:MAG: hypothetical protein EOP45_07730 [Sphingobacteriaceae bacterium]